MPETILVPYNEMLQVFRTILLQQQFDAAKAEACATVFATNSLDGVYSHGVNRFALFVQMVKEGHVHANADSFLVHATPAFEQWDGALAPGVLNAVKATDRVMQVASRNGMGCVALANTNHWMRGGYYGWQAAQKGFVFIGWSNTIANMPAHGALDARLGNNPLVIAVPYGTKAVVLDMAMSQFSYGAMQMAALKGEELSVYGGYDKEGNLTTNPAAILETARTVPIGYWKGAGLSLLLDILCAVLSGGQATYQVSQQKAEKGLSQVFIAIDCKQLSNYAGIHSCIEGIINNYKQSVAEGEILYPGERVIRSREQNRQNGIPVLEKIWQEVLQLQNG